MSQQISEVREHAAGPALVCQVGFRLRFAQAAVWADLVAAFGAYDMRPQHYAALVTIRSEPGCSQQDLAGMLGIKRQNLVSLIDDLARRGLVEREQDADDRRINRLTLSTKGQAFLADLDVAQRDHERRIEALLSLEEQQQLIGFLRKLEKLSPCRD